MQPALGLALDVDADADAEACDGGGSCFTEEREGGSLDVVARSMV
jgi:hypothetical protein